MSEAKKKKEQEIHPMLGAKVFYLATDTVALPATVVKVWSDDCFNLQVFTNGDGGLQFVTSVARHAMKDAKAGNCFVLT